MHQGQAREAHHREPPPGSAQDAPWQARGGAFGPKDSFGAESQTACDATDRLEKISSFHGMK
jgi:hypothetical protein